MASKRKATKGKAIKGSGKAPVRADTGRRLGSPVRAARAVVVEEDDSVEEVELVELDVTEETLDATPGRVLQFLRGVGTNPTIRAGLARRGYTSAEHREGWRLLHETAGFTADISEEEEEDNESAQAIAELDAWDESGFRVIGAALRRLHPEQAEFVLHGISASQGASAVLGVKIVLDRLDQLQSSPQRKATRAADQAALTTLAARGIDEGERARLRELVALAEATPEPVVKDPEAAQAVRDEQLTRLARLREWYVDWATMARVAIRRRDHLIRLGLARKRAAVKKPEVAPPVAPAVGG